MNKMFNINDISGQNDECCAYANQFLPYAHKRLRFNKPVDVNFISDPENAKNPLGNTGYYDPNKMAITIFVDKRHIKDILRSLSHELVHHTQNCRGEFDSGVETGPGYTQKDPHMRKMEAEAYLLGNGFLFRDWEDQLKQKKENITMSEGYKRDKMEEEELEEGMPAADITKDKPCPKNQAKNKQGKCVPVAEEDVIEEAEFDCQGAGDGCDEGQLCVDGVCVDAPNPNPTDNPFGENWTRGNKDKLMFEILMKKWAK